MIPRLHPRIHAAADVVDVCISEFGQRVGGDIAPLSRLAIDDDVVIQSCAHLQVTLGDLPILNIRVGTRNRACHIFFDGADVHQDETFFT